jgi:hypothetical protein
MWQRDGFRWRTLFKCAEDGLTGLTRVDVIAARYVEPVCACSIERGRHRRRVRQRVRTWSFENKSILVLGAIYECR